MNLTHLGKRSGPAWFAWAFGVVLALLPVGCGRVHGAGDETSLAGQESGKVASTLVAEENLGTTETRLGHIDAPFAGSYDVGVRVIVWRNITDLGVSPALARVSLGAWAKSGFIALAQGKDFSEDAYVQFTAKDIRGLIRILERMESIEFLKANPDIQYRDVAASYGGIRFRRYPDRPVEMFVMRNDASNGGGGELWVALDIPEFKQLLEKVANRMLAFDREPAYVRLK